MRAFLMILLSCLMVEAVEAETRAETANKSFVDFPAGCIKDKRYPCTIKSAKMPLEFEIGRGQYSLGEQSALRLESASKSQLLQGSAWVRAGENQEFKINANVMIEFSGDIFAEKSKDMLMHVKNLNAEINFHSKHVFKEESLPVGFQNWYGSLAVDGQVLRGIIRPIEKEVFLKSWMPLAGGSAAELRKLAKSYLDLWVDTISASGDLYQQVAERRLASVKEKEKQATDRAQKKRHEEADLRRLYREKNGL